MCPGGTGKRSIRDCPTIKCASGKLAPSFDLCPDAVVPQNQNGENSGDSGRRPNIVRLRRVTGETATFGVGFHKIYDADDSLMAKWSDGSAMAFGENGEGIKLDQGIEMYNGMEVTVRYNVWGGLGWSAITVTHTKKCTEDIFDWGGCAYSVYKNRTDRLRLLSLDVKCFKYCE